jgi:L-seryl-tRNA(Ser) seleniumtransferase
VAELPYARGEILRSTEDDVTKVERAWREVARRRRSGEALYNFSGLERSLRVEPESIELMDDELAPALTLDRLRSLALEHLGGDAARDDVLVCNRLTAALVAALTVLVDPGQTVAGISAGYSRPAVRRAVALAGGRLVDTSTPDELARALGRDGVRLVVVTRLAVTYDMLDAGTLADAVVIAREAGARVVVDDAGGARVGPAVFGQPRTLELDVDLGATGLDKYGTTGPRLGLLAGRRELVARTRARAFELGLEARPMLYPAVVESLERYDPERVRALVTTTREVAAALTSRLGALVHETPVTAQLRGEDILRHVGGADGVVPYEAAAALAMLLLVEHGILTVHFAAIPPGTSAILIKFVPPELLERFGGAERFADAVAGSLDRLAELIKDERELRHLVLGDD